MQLEDARTAVYTKIGRNVVLFQELEILLKQIVSCSEISGDAKSLEKLIQKRRDDAFRKTLGQLVGDYVEGCLGPDAGKEPSTPETFNGIQLSMKFSQNFGSEFYESKKAELAMMVVERNDLIHHLLIKNDIDSVETCREISEKLDAQNEQIRAEIKRMQAVGESMMKMYADMAAFLQTEEGRNALCGDPNQAFFGKKRAKIRD